MAEYISREQLLERIASQKCEVRETGCKECSIKSFCVYGVVEQFPAADVAPVRHGEWIEDCLFIQCSACGYDFDPMEESTPYCPNCGARMDGEVQSNE